MALKARSEKFSFIKMYRRAVKKQDTNQPENTADDMDKMYKN